MDAGAISAWEQRGDSGEIAVTMFGLASPLVLAGRHEGFLVGCAMFVSGHREGVDLLRWEATWVERRFSRITPPTVSGNVRTVSSVKGLRALRNKLAAFA